MEPVRDFKIFLVDDDIFNLKLTEYHLKSLGYTDVATFKNGMECLNNLSSHPKVVFLDYMMDDIDGFEVLKKIKRFDVNTYVVMLSGQEKMEAAIDSLKYGAFDYIIKGTSAIERITDVMKRITSLQELVERSKPSVWRRIASIL